MLTVFCRGLYQFRRYWSLHLFVYSINIVLLPGIYRLKSPTQFQVPERAPEFQ
ncbi:hypothetical protein I79_004811 [Cricetulus griseus]|nr:hypothetical protein I79_004811 [Cricetulus griseus]